ncbi:transporter substrate-binding domain-containing protein [Alteromonas ponticola]|uniref:diguanylate cyclase n=1 Tax=Alteromonas aquimaris TaxID=2998417 RepID=A0ABT3P7K0_9ALTE|nr:transporter substrate-binding domain-containing protein [Alteromonas aquimaris]MCW8108742.1 transporter substrate-binding domain-containing protein [Alteromonas aquimaris]
MAVWSITIQAQEKDIITYCIDPDWMPYEALRNGAHIGMSADYLALITELTDIRFEFIQTESWQQSVDFVKHGACMMVTLINSTPTNKQFLTFSYPYLEAPNVLIAQEGTPVIQGYSGVGNRVLGIVEGYRHAEYLARYYPSVQVEYVSSEKEGLQKVADGSIDVMVGALLSVNVNINALGAHSLKVVGYAEPFDSLRFGVNKNFTTTLERLNAALNAIPESRKVEIYKRWNTTLVHNESSSMTVLATIAVGGLSLFLMIWYRNTKHKWLSQLNNKTAEVESLQSILLEKDRTLEFLSNHDTVTGLYNRTHMMHKAQEEISRFQRFHSATSLIAVEVVKNSRGSHSQRSNEFENKLKFVAGICLATVREVDIAARWSEEQFIILCPQTTISEAKALADRLMNELRNQSSVDEERLQIAVGVASLHGNETFIEWYDRAAKALYHSRRKGFNVVCLAD